MIDRIENVLKNVSLTFARYRLLRAEFPTATPRMTYVHTRCQCVNCGNECIDQAHISESGSIYFPVSCGCCYDCRSVLADYGYFDEDEFDEDDETYICETCGGQYGDGWSTCTCDDDDHWFWHSLPSDPQEVADDEAN